MKKILLLTLLFSVMIIGSCKKEEPGNSNNPKTEEITLSLINDNVEPGEIVLAQASAEVKVADGTKISVNGNAVNVFGTEDNQIGFIMPVLPSGKVTVDYTNAGIAKQLEVTIKNYTAITNAGTEVQVFTSEIDKVIDNLEEHVKSPIVNLDPEYVELLKYLNQTIKDNFDDLSAEDKIQFAYYLRGNMPDADETKLDSLNSDFYLNKNDVSNDAGESLVKIGKSFAVNVVVGLSTAKLGFALAVLPSPTLLEKVAAVGFLATGLVTISDAVSDAKRIGNLTGVSDKIMEAFKSTIEFSANQEEKIYFKGMYRTLKPSDANSANAIISSIFKSLKSLQTAYDYCVQIANKVIAWFPWKSPKIPTYNSPIGNNNATKLLNLPGKNLTITKVSNAAIKVSSIQEADGLLVKATSQTITAETPFTFTVKCTDPNLGIEIEKDIDALLKPTVYFLLNSKNEWVVPPTKFYNETAQSFYLTIDRMTKAEGIDYSKITYTDKSTNSKTDIKFTKGANSFSLELSHNEFETQYATIEIQYDGKLVQTIAAEVLPKSLDKILIAGSPWKIIYLVNDGQDYFKFHKTGNHICQGVTYWDESRIKEGKMSFTSGGGGSLYTMFENINQIIVPVGNDCKSNGTETVTEDETQSMSWTYNTQTNVIKIPLLVNDDEDEFEVSMSNGVVSLNGAYMQIKLQKP